MEVTLACTIGTAVGAKLNAALELCSGEETMNPEVMTAAGRRRGRKPKRCPTVGQIKYAMAKSISGDMCVLANMGWVDEEGKDTEATVATFEADVASLPMDVLAQLSEEGISACADKMMAKMAKRFPRGRRCASNISEADMADLKETGTKIASYKCFKHTLQSACQDRVRAQVYGFFQAQAEAAAAATTAAATTVAATTAAATTVPAA